MSDFILNLLLIGYIALWSLYFIGFFIIGFAMFGYQSNLSLYLSIILGSSFAITVSLITLKMRAVNEARERVKTECD
jgi:uncharacterized protein (DUF983 family)